MVESSVANPHTLGREYRAFIAINMVHELDLLSRDFTELTLTRTKLGSELTKIWGFDCLCLPLPASACLCLPLPASVCLCLPLPASACLCLPLPASACLCLPLPDAACLCLPPPASACLCLPLPASGYLCLPLPASACLYGCGGGIKQQTHEVGEKSSIQNLSSLLFSSASLLLCLSSSLPPLYASLTYLFCPPIRVLFEARVVLPLRF